jgi:hypothetical protein
MRNATRPLERFPVAAPGEAVGSPPEVCVAIPPVAPVERNAELGCTGGGGCSLHATDSANSATSGAMSASRADRSAGLRTSAISGPSSGRRNVSRAVRRSAAAGISPLVSRAGPPFGRC